MQGKTHRWGGLALGAGATLATVGSIDGFSAVMMTGTLMTGAALGSLIPDLDHQGSELSKKIKPLGMAVSSVCHHRGFTHTGLAWFMFTLVCAAIVTVLNLVKVDNWGTSAIIGGMFALIVVSIVKWIAKTFHINRLRRVTYGFINTLVMTGVLFVIFTLFADYMVKYLGYYFIGLSVGYLSHLLVDMLTVSGVPMLYPHSEKMYRFANLKTGEDDNWVSMILSIATVALVTLRVGLI
ncbi:metal-dependent hydrolase [Paraclostridium bifermentans]